MPHIKKGAARREAQAKGLTRYFDGRKCKHGHVAERLTSCARCVECHREARARRWKVKQEGKKLRVATYGYDPLDLRYLRRVRGLTLSSRKDLVALRKKRKKYGRADRLPRPAQ